MSRRLVMVAAMVLLMAGLVSASSISITATPYSSTDTFDLTAIGTTDWAKFEAGGGGPQYIPRRKSVAGTPVNVMGYLILSRASGETAPPYSSGQNQGNHTAGATFTWTGDGPNPWTNGQGSTPVDLTNGSMAGVIFCDQYQPAYWIYAPSDSTERTLSIWVYAWASGGTGTGTFPLSGTLSDGTTLTNSTYDIISGVADGFMRYDVTYKSDAPGNIRVQWGYAGPTNFRPGVQAAALSTAEIPEPATLLLVGTGVLGVFGYARRRMMK